MFFSFSMYSFLLSNSIIAFLFYVIFKNVVFDHFFTCRSHLRLLFYSLRLFPSFLFSIYLQSPRSASGSAVILLFYYKLILVSYNKLSGVTVCTTIAWIIHTKLPFVVFGFARTILWSILIIWQNKIYFIFTKSV